MAARTGTVTTEIQRMRDEFRLPNRDADDRSMGSRVLRGLAWSTVETYRRHLNCIVGHAIKRGVTLVVGCEMEFVLDLIDELQKADITVPIEGWRSALLKCESAWAAAGRRDATEHATANATPYPNLWGAWREAELRDTGGGWRPERTAG